LGSLLPNIVDKLPKLDSRFPSIQDLSRDLPLADLAKLVDHTWGPVASLDNAIHLLNRLSLVTPQDANALFDAWRSIPEVASDLAPQPPLKKRRIVVEPSDPDIFSHSVPLAPLSDSRPSDLTSLAATVDSLLSQFSAFKSQLESCLAVTASLSDLHNTVKALESKISSLVATPAPVTPPLTVPQVDSSSATLPSTSTSASSSTSSALATATLPSTADSKSANLLDSKTKSNRSLGWWRSESNEVIEKILRSHPDASDYHRGSFPVDALKAFVSEAPQDLNEFIRSGNIFQDAFKSKWLLNGKHRTGFAKISDLEDVYRKIKWALEVLEPAPKSCPIYSAVVTFSRELDSLKRSFRISDFDALSIELELRSSGLSRISDYLPRVKEIWRGDAWADDIKSFRTLVWPAILAANSPSLQQVQAFALSSNLAQSTLGTGLTDFSHLQSPFLQLARPLLTSGSSVSGSSSSGNNHSQPPRFEPRLMYPTRGGGGRKTRGGSRGGRGGFGGGGGSRLNLNDECLKFSKGHCNFSFRDSGCKLRHVCPVSGCSPSSPCQLHLEFYQRLAQHRTQQSMPHLQPSILNSQQPSFQQLQPTFQSPILSPSSSSNYNSFLPSPPTFPSFSTQASSQFTPSLLQAPSGNRH
jgi:hypothetical protein